MDCSTPGFPCLSLSPEVFSNSCTLSRWCHPTISSSVTPFSCPQSFPVSGSLSSFISGGQSNGASASASILPVNIQGLFPLGLTSLISLQFKGLWRVLQHHSSKASVLRCSAFFMVQLSHPYVTTGKTIALTRQTFVTKLMSLLSNTRSRFVIAFLPRSIAFLSWLQSPSTVILEPKETKSVSVSIVFPHLFAMKWWDQMPWS